MQWLDGLQGTGIRPGLSRIRALLRELKHPERAYRSIIVAGTNGKGSTSAMIESIVRASGVSSDTSDNVSGVVPAAMACRLIVARMPEPLGAR